MVAQTHMWTAKEKLLYMLSYGWGQRSNSEIISLAYRLYPWTWTPSENSGVYTCVYFTTQTYRPVLILTSLVESVSIKDQDYQTLHRWEERLLFFGLSTSLWTVNNNNKNNNNNNKGIWDRASVAPSTCFQCLQLSHIYLSACIIQSLYFPVFFIFF